MNSLGKRSHQGFTLVELLVGLAISLLVGLVAISYLVSSSRLLTNQNATDLIQENARFAFDLLSSESRLAGLNDTDNTEAVNSDTFLFVDGVSSLSICNDTLNTAPTATSNIACNSDGLSYSLNGTDIDTDRLAIDYVTDTGTTCTGFNITQELKVVSVYWVADIDGDGIPSLYCMSYTSAYSFLDRDYTAFVPRLPAIPLVDGIETLQVQFGVDTDADAVDADGNPIGDAGIESYRTYANIAANNRDNIRSAKIGLLVSSGQVIASQRSSEDGVRRTYSVLGQPFQVLADDKIERKSLATTIRFQNLPPARL